MLKFEHPHLFFLQYEMENIWGESNFFKHHNVGTCLRHVSMQSAMYQRLGNMPKACPYAMALSFLVILHILRGKIEMVGMVKWWE